MVIAGKDKGKIGKVLKILVKKDKVLVEKVNMVQRHTKANPYAQHLAGLSRRKPIHVSNVAVVCDACTKPRGSGTRRLKTGRKFASARSATRSSNRNQYDTSRRSI